MEKVLLVFVFVFSLFLKVTIAAGAEVAKSPEVKEEVAEESVEEANSPKSVSEKNTTINNNINVSPFAGNNPSADAASVLGTKQSAAGGPVPVAITPLLGSTAYNGNWYNHVRNSYTLGLLLEVPASERFSIELEGTFARSNISYSYFNHDFNQYSVGANGKYYFSRSMIQPYAGIGASAIRYENMSYGLNNPLSRYSLWMGAAQAVAGLDVEVAQKTAVGIRGEWVLPVINRPASYSNGNIAYPNYEEASLMNTTFFRVMGSVRLSF